jgi:hypothetical protein
MQRTVATGDLARVPPFDPAITLMQTGFAGARAILAIDAPSQPKGWRASPLVDAGWGVTKREGRAQLGMTGGASTTVDASAPLILAQQVRSPFAGSYTLQVRLRGAGETPELFEQVFVPNFRVRVQFFQFTERTKCALNRRELAGVDVVPKFAAGADDWQTVELAKEFFNPNLGANFSFGLGLGIAVVVERSTTGPLEFPAGNEFLGVEVADVRLVFDGKPRVDTVRI